MKPLKTLPEQTACKVLCFTESLVAKQVEEECIRRENALAKLPKYRSRFKSDKFVLEDCYER